MKLFKQVIKNNKGLIIFYILIGFVITFLDLYSITYYQKILDLFTAKNLSIKILIIYGLLLILSTILNYIENYPEEKLKNKLYYDFKLQSLRKLKTIDYQEYQKFGTGKFTQIVNDGAEASRNILMNYYFKIIRYLMPTIIFSLFFIYKLKKEYIIFILFSYLLVIVISRLILEKLYNLKESILINKEKLNKYFIRGFMELVIFRTHKKYDEEIKITNNEIENVTNNMTKIKLVHEAFFTIFGLLVNVIKVLILAYALIHKKITIGSIVSILSLLDKAYEPIAIFNVEYVDYKLNKVSVKRYIDLLDLKDDKGLIDGIKLNKINGNITFKNISFSYNKNKIIDDLSFKIKKNSSNAFVGSSGTGKSTIVKLILGFLKYDQGQILIDDKELSKINLYSYYDKISYVSQDSFVFDGSLRENLIFNKNIKDDEILKVLDLVCLDKFYKKLKNGLDTNLGEKGIKMSGGERQRCALARLFFDDSKIIILDEATSALDNITEKKVMENIFKYLKNKTVIIVAHRLETIKNVDKIFVIDDGKIKEEGTYAELMSENKYFSKLYKSNIQNNR